MSRFNGIIALSPIGLFMALYLIVSFAIGDFYKMPLSVALIAASVWAIATSRKGSLTEKIEIFSRGAANSNILYMIWIFVLAGAFSELAKGVGSIEASVNLALSVIPESMILPGLFVVACFISLSIGTSVGTIVALTPFACELALITGINVPLVVSIVLGGSFFGDNLSFISDTTIAATRSLNCRMNEKFKANILIAMPAAIIALVAYTVVGEAGMNEITPSGQTNPWLIIPYLVVIVSALAGMNVLLVLSLGIASATLLALLYTNIALIDMCTLLGDGINSMGNLIVVTLLAAGLLELIKHNGGIDCLINWMSRHINGKSGAQASIAMLVGMVNICTANNTIAIISVGGIAKEISDRFGLQPRKVASILDTCSCIVQNIIPYGAQTLLAASIAHESPVAFLQYSYYAAALAISVTISILFTKKQP